MGYKIEIINQRYDAHIAEIIKKVGAEFGAVGEGYGPSDDEVQAMSVHYQDNKKSRYLVAILDGEVVGGVGIAPFNGEVEVCELRKLFLLPQCRGLGIGKQLVLQCLQYAKDKNFKRCYLDTLSCMGAAISLYEKLGFEHLAAPLSGTTHGACDIWMLKTL
ncbi:GNAT family N-acetyltransferase [Psychromonas sp. psych-6C06]|uniref:GNAT family N-acetyltransferase n=1 Tax=Psychromonas sp. psych-6C06 TaxID=2058089 RepID=UPI000C32F80F|nr:GNAT family N-acetyltransferase [Psychromonas sp. psych-6C06]PKF60421.1 GNAT family N-acetyltransferase [Psychromonas sp. psych-6C06]